MSSILVQLYGEKWSVRNMFRRATCRKPILKRKKPRVGYFPLPNGKIVPFEEYVHEMGETPDLLEARPPGWDENKEERRVNKRTRNQLFRTIIFASIAHFLFSYGYNQISLMQNYLHESQYFMQIKYMPDYYNNYGHVQLLAKYGLATVTAMFAPYIIRIVQDKWILFVSAGAFGIFTSLGFLDAKYTIMPSGFVAGLAWIPFFVTYSMYMVHISQRLGDLNQKRPYNGIQANWLLYKFNTLSFFGWFFGVALSGMSCSLLFHGMLERNNTYIIQKKLTCGGSYCDSPWPNWWDKMMYEPDIPSIDQYAYANIVNASLLIVTMAMFLFGCVEGQTTKTWSQLNDKGFELNFKLGWRAIFNWRRTMLAPIFIFMGWSTDFIAYAYTRAYPICSMNGWSFFICIAGFGVCAALVATVVPWLAIKKTGWGPIMIGGVFCFFFGLFVMIFWTPVTSRDEDGNDHTPHTPTTFDEVMVYLVPAMWGIGTGALYAAVNVRIEFEYPDPDDMIAMFCVYHHWKAIGVVISYITRSTATCTSSKLYALVVNLVIGIFFYIWYERKRLHDDPDAPKADAINLVRFVPNPNPELMANESEVEDEGTSTSEEDEAGRPIPRRRRRRRRRRRKLPPNDPKLGEAWRTPLFPKDLEIPRKYITPDGHILIMPRHAPPPFEVQDAFDSNQLRKTDIDKVTSAARKVCFQLGWGGEPLFYDVDEVLADERLEYPCKYDMRGCVIPGREEEPDYYEEDLASNPRHNYPARFQPALERLRLHREELAQKKLRREERGWGTSDDDDFDDDDESRPLLQNNGMNS